MNNISVVFKVNKSYHIHATLSTGIKLTIKVLQKTMYTHRHRQRDTDTNTHT